MDLKGKCPNCLTQTVQDGFRRKCPECGLVSYTVEINGMVSEAYVVKKDDEVVIRNIREHLDDLAKEIEADNARLESLTVLRERCENCGAVVPECGTDFKGRKICCPHCIFNPEGCRCRFGDFGEPLEDV